MKEQFPEFKSKQAALNDQANGHQKRVSKLEKGLDLEQLKELLKTKISSKTTDSDELLNSIINKLNHKAENSITWTEFL